MCEKFNYEGHAINVMFKDEVSLEITVRSLATGDTYHNENVHLQKITKDTIYATLSRKNEKGLLCLFRYLDVEPRQIIISFVVRLDYLPEFVEDLTLTKVSLDSQIMTKMSAQDMQNEIHSLDNILDHLKENGPMIMRTKDVSLSGKTEIDLFQVDEGTYLLQLSGIIFTNNNIADILSIIIEVKGKEPIELHMKANCMTSYGYPYSFIKQVNVRKATDVKVFAQYASGGSPKLTNHITTLLPIINSA